MTTRSKALIILLSLLASAAGPSAQPASQAPATRTQAELSDVPQGDVQRGATEWGRCVNCHGPQAEGAFGPSLAGVGLSWMAFRKAVRQPWGIMPMFTERQKSDQALADIYAHLKTLPRPTMLGEWHWRKAPPTAPLGQRLYMNFAGCGQCHEPENKFGRTWLGEYAKDVTFEYFKKQIYQHLEKWPKGTMPIYSEERLPEPILREIYTWMVDELGMRPSIAGALTVGEQQGGKTSYTLMVSNVGVKDKGLAAEGLTIFVRIPPGCSAVGATGAGYAGVMPLAKLGLEPALRLAPHSHDDSGHVERPAPDLSGDVAVWKVPRIDAGERLNLSLTLSGPAPSPDVITGFAGSTVYWTTPGRRPAGSPPRMVYRDLRMPDKGDHELIRLPSMPRTQ
jgi:mono/diheme cytochrome c family protein